MDTLLGTLPEKIGFQSSIFGDGHHWTAIFWGKLILHGFIPAMNWCEAPRLGSIVGPFCASDDLVMALSFYQRGQFQALNRL